MRDLLEELLALLPEEKTGEVSLLKRTFPTVRDGSGGALELGELPGRREKLRTERREERAASAAELYEQVNGGRLRTTRRGPETVTVYAAEPETGAAAAAARDARTLDRVFRRDARRYDGGLGLL